MRPAFRVLRAVAALGGAAALLVPAFTAPAGAEDQTVSVGEGGENAFTPATVRIRPGDTVTWQYAGGSDHTVTSRSGDWSKDDPVGPPALLSLSTSYMFDTPGTYRYVCETHESVGMKGTVVVEGRPRPTSSPTRTSSPRPTATRTTPPPPPPTTSESPSPSPSVGSASPALPSSSVLTPSPQSGAPSPSIAPPDGTPRDLGEGGLTPQPATPRGKGLPIMLALLLIGGVGSAELRALLASAPR